MQFDIAVCRVKNRCFSKYPTTTQKVCRFLNDTVFFLYPSKNTEATNKPKTNYININQTRNVITSSLRDFTERRQTLNFIDYHWTGCLVTECNSIASHQYRVSGVSGGEQIQDVDRQAGRNLSVSKPNTSHYTCKSPDQDECQGEYSLSSCPIFRTVKEAVQIDCILDFKPHIIESVQTMALWHGDGTN